MNYKNTVTIKQALDKMVSELKIKGKLDESRIRDAWVEIMGKTVARYTTKITLNKSKLYVEVSSSISKHELNYLKEEIMERVNKELGGNVIKEVVVYG